MGNITSAKSVCNKTIVSPSKLTDASHLKLSVNLDVKYV